MVQISLGGAPEAKDMNMSSHDDEEIATKEQVNETKDTSGANQAGDSNNNNSNSEEDMPALEALIRRIAKEGHKPVEEKVEFKEEWDDQSKGPSPQ